jgi:hypothetical protein
MFSIPRTNVIASDTGFSIEVLGRSGLRYTEDNRSLMIESEVATGPSGLIIYSRSIRNWLPPYADDLIDQEKRDQIVKNIESAFAFRGIDIDVL